MSFASKTLEKSINLGFKILEEVLRIFCVGGDLISDFLLERKNFTRQESLQNLGGIKENNVLHCSQTVSIELL
mgnify:CR=1